MILHCDHKHGLTEEEKQIPTRALRPVITIFSISFVIVILASSMKGIRDAMAFIDRRLKDPLLPASTIRPAAIPEPAVPGPSIRVTRQMSDL